MRWPIPSSLTVVLLLSLENGSWWRMGGGMGFGFAQAQSLTTAQVQQVEDILANIATQSWEYGTRMQSLLSLNVPSFSATTPKTGLPPTKNPSSSVSSALQPVISLAQEIIQNRTAYIQSHQNTTSGPQPLFPGSGAIGDPASNGVGVLIANLVNQTGGVDFQTPLDEQLEYLLSVAPRTSDGAISHRQEQVQLWADFVYMAPPFIALYGAYTGNQSLLEEAYTQCQLYRNYLRESNGSVVNLWRHIQLGSDVDDGHWSTGMAWAASGMVRVLGTIQNSKFAKSMKNEQSDLTTWVNEIHDAMYTRQQSSGLFLDYADGDPTANGSFEDASSTAMLAASVYHLSLLAGQHKWLPAAEKAREALSTPGASNSSAMATALSGMLHFTNDGLLTPVVNPEDFTKQGTQSPEGQAFVLEMQAAWNAWVQGGSKGANAAPHSATLNAIGILSVALLVTLLVV